VTIFAGVGAAELWDAADAAPAISTSALTTATAPTLVDMAF
jgi:hypothetical protein